jgi:hypothetical protein
MKSALSRIVICLSIVIFVAAFAADKTYKGFVSMYNPTVENAEKRENWFWADEKEFTIKLKAKELDIARLRLFLASKDSNIKQMNKSIGPLDIRNFVSLEISEPRDATDSYVVEGVGGFSDPVTFRSVRVRKIDPETNTVESNYFIFAHSKQGTDPLEAELKNSGLLEK